MGGKGVRVGTGHGPGTPGPTLPVERGPAGRISLTEKQSFDDTTLTADVLINKMQTAYFAGLKRCYRNYLKKDATAKGKLVLKLTVNATGRAIDAGAAGVSDEVAGCVTGQMAGWRFFVPKDRDGEPATASFRIVLTLVAD